MENEDKLGNIESLEKDGQLGLKSENSPFATTFYFEDFYDDKLIKKFIKSTERCIRQSKEYKLYIEQLRSNYSELNRDVLQANITTLDSDMEFHHYPFSLYDLVETYMIHCMLNKIRFTTFSVAKKILELHSEHVIGLVPLTPTNHELVHNGNFFISSKQIFGDYKSFMKTYDKAISTDMKNKIREMEDASSKNTPSDFMGLI